MLMSPPWSISCAAAAACNPPCFYLRDPITARLGAGWCGALQGSPCRPHGRTRASSGLAWARRTIPGVWVEKQGAEQQNSSCSASLGYPGRLGNGRRHWGALAEGPSSLSEGFSQKPEAVPLAAWPRAPWATAILIAI